MKILQATKETTINNILFMANVLSNVEQLKGMNPSTSVAPHYKHTTQDIWWFRLDPVAEVMGQYGSPIFAWLTGKVGDTDVPVVSEYVLEIKEFEDDQALIDAGYMDPLGGE